MAETKWILLAWNYEGWAEKVTFSRIEIRMEKDKTKAGSGWDPMGMIL